MKTLIRELKPRRKPQKNLAKSYIKTYKKPPRESLSKTIIVNNKIERQNKE